MKIPTHEKNPWLKNQLLEPDDAQKKEEAVWLRSRHAREIRMATRGRVRTRPEDGTQIEHQLEEKNDRRGVGKKEKRKQIQLGREVVGKQLRTSGGEIW